MVWGAIASAAGSITGGLIQNAQNKSLARMNNRFQAHMSNTAHQREVDDLRAAGLNPILSATGGNGASSPSGSQATAENILEPAISSARQGARLKEELKNMRMQNYAIETQGVLNDELAAKTSMDAQASQSQNVLNKALTAKALEEAKLTNNNARTAAANARLTEAALPAALTKEGINQSSFGKAMQYIDRVTETIGGATGAIKKGR